MRLAIYSTTECPYPIPRGMIQAALGIAGTIADGAAERGHAVDFFCTTESKTRAHKRSLGYKALINLPIHQTLSNGATRDAAIYAYSQRFVYDMVRYLERHPVDVVHLHNVREALPLLQFLPTIPKVVTVHDNLYLPQQRFLLNLYKNVPNTYFVSISKRQRHGLPSLSYIANVYNGIDTTLFRFNAKPKNYLIFSGRLIPEKGIDLALQAARSTRLPLHVLGMFEPRQTVDPKFIAQVKLGLQASSVKHRHNVSREQLASEYGNAQALLAPIRWEEPFGLVLIEAMACGTPVIAFKHGAAAEIIRDGKTGFVVRTLAEMTRAIKKIPTINRQTCRDHVVKYFSYDTMVEQYLSVYQSVCKRRPRL